VNSYSAAETAIAEADHGETLSSTFELAAADVARKAAVPTHSRTKRSLSAFVITETELKLIAAAATIGLSNRPNAG
jgi:hypothetical protein